MTTNADQLERDILRVFRCACRQGRQDIAEFMLAALEKLDGQEERRPVRCRALIEAYQEIFDAAVHQAR
ncbi:hypothetical protein K7H91_23465 [Martelella mediterranea]|uniref:hypothetical protein n=1 Tax=Martelella mediterranea TaxID=293089 RepID=UPI001E5A78F7|nr:hypothetical protein [Martelella mediterranea]MCD1636717.1 hypothetical protein [Martelella mediterranea]